MPEGEKEERRQCFEGSMNLLFGKNIMPDLAVSQYHPPFLKGDRRGILLQPKNPFHLPFRKGERKQR
jgi:hypothetical protein